MPAGGRSSVRGNKEKVMKQRKLVLMACAALGIALGAPPSQAADIAVNLGSLSIDIDFGPPPQRFEPVPPPRFGHVWAPGYWRATGRHHEWIAGRWIEARRDHAWIADRWVPVGHRWRHEPGRWERQTAVHNSQRHYDAGFWRSHDADRHSRYQ
jgi:hypothetical protein